MDIPPADNIFVYIHLRNDETMIFGTEHQLMYYTWCYIYLINTGLFNMNYNIQSL